MSAKSGGITLVPASNERSGYQGLEGLLKAPLTIVLEAPVIEYRDGIVWLMIGPCKPSSPLQQPAPRKRGRPRVERALSPAQEGDGFLSTLEAAALTKMSVSWYESQRSNRTGPPFYKRGRRVRYLKSELVAWWLGLEIEVAKPRGRGRPRKRGQIML